MKNSLLSRVFFATVLLTGFSAHSEMKWGFADASFNHLDWSKGTEDKSTKEDFNYLELEGGALFNWGEVYGFFDIENPGKTGSETRTAGKGSINYYLFNTGLSLYGHVYNFAAAGFSEQNRVTGLGYTIANEKYWIKPFIGFHEVSQTFYSGSNGYMAGWVVGYFFKIAGQSFLLADWHEYEFARNEKYAAGNGGRRESHNGAVSVWWNATEHFTGGVQYRYATDKLGTGGSLGAMIYTFKYVF